MSGLIDAAKKEGELNVIALPPDWANYGAIIKAFGDKYGIKVNSAQPDAASQDEINAATQQKGKSSAPDVFDLGQAVAHLTVQASALGLGVHQFAAFDHDGLTVSAGVPPHWRVTTGLAIGRPVESELVPRSRRPLGELAFGARFGEPLPL